MVSSHSLLLPSAASSWHDMECCADDEQPWRRCAELGTSGDEAPAEWLGEVEALWLSYEHNPFNGKAFFNEVMNIITCLKEDAGSRHQIVNLCSKRCELRLTLQVVFFFKPARLLITADLFW